MLKQTLAFCAVILSFFSAHADDANPWTRLVDRNLHVYSVVRSLRDPAEKSVLKGDSLQIRYRKDLRKLSQDQRDKFICEATRWMIAGRRDSSPGLGRLLKEEPRVGTVKFVAYAVETSVSLNREGRYDQARSLIPQMVLSIDRKRAGRIDAKAASKNLRGASCLTVAKALLSEVWTNSF